MDKKRLKDIYRILENLSVNEKELQRTKAREPGKQLAQSVFLWGGLLPFTLALVLTASYLLFPHPVTKIVALVLLLVSYIAALVTPVIDIFIHRRSLMKFFRDPWILAHENVLTVSDVDADTVLSLQQIGIEELTFAKLQISAEREALERRTSLFVGALEKVGLLSGILGICVIILKIGEVTKRAAEVSALPWWMLALAYAAIGLQLLAISVHMVLIRMDRHIKLLDFSINHRSGTSSASSIPALDEARSRRLKS